MLFLARWAGHEECHSGSQIDPMHKLCTEAHIVAEHPKAQCTLVTFSGNGTGRDCERRATSRCKNDFVGFQSAKSRLLPRLSGDVGGFRVDLQHDHLGRQFRGC